MFQVKKEASKQNMLVSFSGKCLQDKYQKYNSIDEDCKEVRKNLKVSAKR